MFCSEKKDPKDNWWGGTKILDSSFTGHWDTNGESDLETIQTSQRRLRIVDRGLEWEGPKSKE